MSPAHETIFARLGSTLSNRSAEQASTDLLEYLRHDAIHYIDLIEHHLDMLLGALAILNQERTSEVAIFLQLEHPPNPLAVMEASQGQRAFSSLGVEHATTLEYRINYAVQSFE